MLVEIFAGWREKLRVWVRPSSLRVSKGCGYAQDLLECDGTVDGGEAQALLCGKDTMAEGCTRALREAVAGGGHLLLNV